MLLEVGEAANQPSPVKVREAAMRQNPVEVAEATQLVQLKADDTSGMVHQDVNGQSPIEVREAATQQHFVDVSKVLYQKCPEVLQWWETQSSLDGSYVLTHRPKPRGKGLAWAE